MAIATKAIYKHYKPKKSKDMRNLFKLFWMFLVAAVVWSCANEDLEMPQETAPEKTTTKITLEEAQQDLMKLLGDLNKVRSRSETSFWGIN